MNKYTPGPYLREENTVYSLHMGDDSTSHKPCNRFWASVSTQASNKAPAEELDAVVRLFTAATEMAEALQQARQYVVGAYECAFPDAEANADVLAQIDEALTKAGLR